MDIPRPNPNTLITRYLKCVHCYKIIGHYVIRYERHSHTVLTDVGEISRTKFCRRCLSQLKGTPL